MLAAVADPEALGRVELAVVVLAGILIIDVAWELFRWWNGDRKANNENPPNRRRNL